jgi:UDP-N-acetylglucosamine diphosphorylase / glucose-1-phosphate thymidylyltransferase / UDP-N-acetylgalactosamine diphosphorylase / glucosamine-1-phosphate N-acetyltransferase / galactosamine-1-phosphate N-acetyltransferase
VEKKTLHYNDEDGRVNTIIFKIFVGQKFSINSFFSLEMYSHASLFKECHFPWEALLFLKEYLKTQPLGKIEVDIPASAFLLHPELISIGSGSKVEPGAYIAGPCIIGRNCEIRHGAYLRGNVLTGDACIIGHATEIKNSILFNRVSASHFNYVGDSILGNDVNLGAGVICANYRLDHQNVPVYFQGKKIVTPLKKLGALIGDESQLGCNSVISPGALLEKKVHAYPCSNIRGFVSEGSCIKPPSLE